MLVLRMSQRASTVKTVCEGQLKKKTKKLLVCVCLLCVSLEILFGKEKEKILFRTSYVVVSDFCLGQFWGSRWMAPGLVVVFLWVVLLLSRQCVRMVLVPPVVPEQRLPLCLLIQCCSSRVGFCSKMMKGLFIETVGECDAFCILGLWLKSLVS